MNGNQTLITTEEEEEEDLEWLNLSQLISMLKRSYWHGWNFIIIITDK